MFRKHRIRFVAIALTVGTLAAACTQTSASGSPSTTVPTTQQTSNLSVEDFAGTWKGKSQAGRSLEMTVSQDGKIVYLFDGLDLGPGNSILVFEAHQADAGCPRNTIF